MAPKPAGPDALYAQALALYRQGQWDAAIVLCRDKLLPRAPHHRDGLSLLGVACFLQDDLPASEHYLQTAIAAGAGAETHTNLGMTLNALHRPDAAEAAYRRAVALDPRQAKAWNNLGNLLARSFQASRRDEALHCYRQALAAEPEYANAHTNLGFELESRNDLAAAERCYREALRIQPRFLPAIGNLADLLRRLKQPEEALRYYRQAIVLDPHNPKLVGNALSLRREFADWCPGRKPTAVDLVAALDRGEPSELAPLHLLALPECSAELLRSAAQRFARERWAWALSQPPLVAAATPREGALRIGYLSADFRNHPVAHLVTEVIAAQERTQSEVFLYAYGPPADNAPRRALQQAADHFIDIGAMDDLEAARRIRDDGIDVLVDLTGYTTHTRLGISALRPAPVIASWLGYIGSLGEPRLADYVIGDAIATPPASAHQFSETLALMPECYQPNGALVALPAPPSRADEGLPEDALVFCSFNQMFKLNPQLWDDWCHILQAVPDSVLWLAPPGSETTAQNLRDEAGRRGVAPERLIFALRQPLAAHQARIALADIALDTFPYNSGTTASDVLRAGVPLVTRAGETFVSRMAMSLLHTVGLPELVAVDSAGYRELAIALAQEAPRRQALRAALAERVPASALFRPERFARQLDALLRAMHAQALEGRRAIIQMATGN